jgi:hypothetical protein
MIKLIFESAGCPDYSRIACAYMDREYTVFDFIDEILKKHPKDYGRIDIDGKISYEYKDGALDWALIPQDLFNRVIEKVGGMSSYYNTDYKLILKGDKPKEEEKTPADKLMGIFKEMQRELHDVRLKYEKKTGMNILSIKTDQSGSINLSTDYRNGVFGFDIVV